MYHPQLLVLVLCSTFTFVRPDGMLVLRQPDGSYSMANLINSPGLWTDWLNGCTQQFMGDFETVWDYKNTWDYYGGTCKLWCHRPLAVKWRLASKNGFRDPPSEVEKCVVLNIDGFTSGMFIGFQCMNSDQSRSPCSKDFCSANSMLSAAMPNVYKKDMNCDRCPDFEVQYLCPPEEPRPTNTSQPCNTPSARSLRVRQLQRQLEENQKVMEEAARELENSPTETKVKVQSVQTKMNDDVATDVKKLLQLLLEEDETK